MPRRYKLIRKPKINNKLISGGKKVILYFSSPYTLINYSRLTSVRSKRTCLILKPNFFLILISLNK